MQATVGNLTSPRVADGDGAGAKSWLARRLAWERRLRDLETNQGTRTGARVN